MKLNEYLAKNAVKLMIKGSGEKNPTRQTNDLGMYDYVENLESVLGKMVWICDYRANADPTKKPIRNIKPTPVVVTDAKETSKTIYYSPVYFRPVNRGRFLQPSLPHWTTPGIAAAPALPSTSSTRKKSA